MRWLRLLLIALLATALPQPASAAVLTLDIDGNARRMGTVDLLARKDVQEIVAADDSSQIVALDGFVAELSVEPLIARNGSRAWLAIEDASLPWPPLAAGKRSAGPFYLVWTDADKAQISPEQWPFQISTIRVLDAVEARFPRILPDAGLAVDDPEWTGFSMFRKHCFACHTLNGEGDARLGPDLNQPHNPTEYLRADFLRTYIRNPQSLRHWPQAKMPGFSTDTLSDTELDALLTYLTHMAAQRKAQ